MLEGRLVRLRALEPSDLENAYTWVNDREVTQYLMVRYPWSRAREEKYLSEASAEDNSFHDVRLAIETRDGVHIGMCGLHRARPEDRGAELGIMIGDKSFWSNGYGTDTVQTLLTFAFDQMNMYKVALGVFEFNERAQACYRKCGFIEEGRAREEYFQDGRYWDIVRMGILRREWEALQAPNPARAAIDVGHHDAGAALGCLT
ncbi:MAG TPA: GNAT family protein [Dehalococcoidia bacterium]|jgi:RimJ/RimL family protein N-acetyltransferase|nr:GNAT family protein [Dehalococcoidia bacterium]